MFGGFSGLRSYLCFLQMMVVLASLKDDLQLAVGWFAAEYQMAGMRNGPQLEKDGVPTSVQR